MLLKTTRTEAEVGRKALKPSCGMLPKRRRGLLFIVVYATPPQAHFQRLPKCTYRALTFNGSPDARTERFFVNGFSNLGKWKSEKTYLQMIPK